MRKRSAIFLAIVVATATTVGISTDTRGTPAEAKTML